MKIINLKDKKGITLITLVITIIVLMILAGVTVTALTGEKSTIKEAKDAASSAEQQSAKEKVQAAILGATKKDGSIDVEILEKKLGITIGELPAIVTINGVEIGIFEDGTVGKAGNFAEVKNSFYVSENTIVEDDYKNTFILPEGFKLRVDETTNNADTVNEGIVIEDQKGNQFVWIPVGRFNIDSVGNTETVELGRYFFAENGDATVRNDVDIEEEKKTNSKNYRKCNSKRYRCFYKKSK